MGKTKIAEDMQAIAEQRVRQIAEQRAQEAADLRMAEAAEQRVGVLLAAQELIPALLASVREAAGRGEYSLRWCRWGTDDTRMRTAIGHLTDYLLSEGFRARAEYTPSDGASTAEAWFIDVGWGIK